MGGAGRHCHREVGVTDLVHHGPTIATQALRALRHHPDRIAFVTGATRLTYRAALEFIGGMQAVMVAGGLRRGQRIAILTANRPEAWCAGIAANATALSITWLHPLGSLADQIEQIEDGECVALVVDAEGFLQRGGGLARANRLSTIYTLGRAEFGTDLIAAASGVGAATPRDLAASTDIAVLNYTGGTTGKAKGALRTHVQVAAYVTSIVADFEIPIAPRYLVIAPMSHVAGTKILPSLILGGTVHLLRGFDPEAVLATIARERIDFTLLVPTMIYVLLDHPHLGRADLTSLQLLLYGASPMSPARLLEGLERIGPVFSQLYGQTECYPISVLRKGDHDRTRPELFSSCGAPVTSCDIRVVNDRDEEVGRGQPGEICVRAAHAVSQYWKRPQETQDLFRNGWLHTGDIARMDEQGYLYILDRKRDMIVSGGFNIYPRDVEDTLSSHPDVAMACVIGIPDAKWGEAVCALVVARPGTQPAAASLVELVKDRKGAAHAPKRIEFVDRLPLTAVGKVDKKAVRSRYWAGQERMVG
jgi:fatty-acyl-CoA synthase